MKRICKHFYLDLMIVKVVPDLPECLPVILIKTISYILIKFYKTKKYFEGITT